MNSKAKTDLIVYPRFKELHEKIRECQELSKLAGEPKCLSLDGQTGAGKSTLVRAYANAFPPVEMETGRKMPVFYLEVPASVTIKGLASTMLSRLGDPGAHKGSLWAFNDRLPPLIEKMGIEIIILDEFQHLIETRTNKVMRDVSDWLKSLIKQTGIPCVVVGITGEVEVILRANPQLSRLFSHRETLEPFAWDTSQPKTIQSFAKFIEYAEEAVGCKLTDTIPRLDLIYRIHYATDGVVGMIMNLMWTAMLRAKKHDQVVIELEDLEFAFIESIGKHLYQKTNPFTTNGNGALPPVQTKSASSPSAPAQKVKPKKRKGVDPSISQTLSAS